VTEDEVLQLIGYIKSLASDATEDEASVAGEGSPPPSPDEG
jgi:hypothetical protein